MEFVAGIHMIVLPGRDRLGVPSSDKGTPIGVQILILMSYRGRPWDPDDRAGSSG